VHVGGPPVLCLLRAGCWGGCRHAPLVWSVWGGASQVCSCCGASSNGCCVCLRVHPCGSGGARMAHEQQRMEHSSCLQLVLHGALHVLCTSVRAHGGHSMPGAGSHTCTRGSIDSGPLAGECAVPPPGTLLSSTGTLGHAHFAHVSLLPSNCCAAGGPCCCPHGVARSAVRCRGRASAVALTHMRNACCLQLSPVFSAVSGCQPDMAEACMCRCSGKGGLGPRCCGMGAEVVMLPPVQKAFPLVCASCCSVYVFPLTHLCVCCTMCWVVCAQFPVLFRFCDSQPAYSSSRCCALQGVVWCRCLQ
jgi:hypothetical protein